jgi:hypothetical protein
MKRKYILLALLPMICMLFSTLNLQAQALAVNEYFRKGMTLSLEILVIDDAVDLRGYSIKSANLDLTALDDQLTFNNISLWSVIRKGTIIVLVDGGATVDDDPSDGYLEFNISSSTYFTQSGSGFSISNNGMLFQIVDDLGAHVHALGHQKTSMGPLFTSVLSPKAYEISHLPSNKGLALQNNVFDGNEGTLTPSHTMGFGNTPANVTFVETNREPGWTSPSLSTLRTGAPDQTDLSWNSAADENPGDKYLGYMIVRVPMGTAFTYPTDGLQYVVGDAIGAGEVLAVQDNTAANTFQDKTALSCSSYDYRIYPYKFNTNGTTSSDRGRSYNQISFASSTVDDGVIAADAVTGSFPVCENEGSETYSIPSISHATSYTWTLPSGVSLVSGSGTNSILVNFTNSGQKTISVAPEYSCGTGTPANFTITVNPKPFTSNINF